jgi:single-strand DNA-binding protein
MASLNRVLIMGNLGRDPELRYTPSQTAICSLNIATNEDWTDKSGVRQKKTEWHRVVVWGKQGEQVSKYLKKGSQVFVEGSLTTSSWDDAETGKKRYKTEIKAQRVHFLDRKGEGTSPSPMDGGTPFEGDDTKFADDDIPF